MKIKIPSYLHSNKEEMTSNLEEYCEMAGIKITEKALRKFSYALYEVKFDIEVDTETGEHRVLSVEEGKNQFSTEEAKRLADDKHRQHMTIIKLQRAILWAVKFLRKDSDYRMYPSEYVANELLYKAGMKEEDLK